MISMEREALAKISEIKRPVQYKTVASKMKIGVEYGRLICNSLGGADYIDVDIKGTCKITPKGKDFLKSKQDARRMI